MSQNKWQLGLVPIPLKELTGFSRHPSFSESNGKGEMEGKGKGTGKTYKGIERAGGEGCENFLQ